MESDYGMSMFSDDEADDDEDFDQINSNIYDFTKLSDDDNRSNSDQEYNEYHIPENNNKKISNKRNHPSKPSHSKPHYNSHKISQIEIVSKKKKKKRGSGNFARISGNEHFNLLVLGWSPSKLELNNRHALHLPTLLRVPSSHATPRVLATN